MTGRDWHTEAEMEQQRDAELQEAERQTTEAAQEIEALRARLATLEAELKQAQAARTLAAGSEAPRAVAELVTWAECDRHEHGGHEAYANRVKVASLAYQRVLALQQRAEQAEGERDEALRGHESDCPRQAALSPRGEGTTPAGAERDTEGEEPADPPCEGCGKPTAEGYRTDDDVLLCETCWKGLTDDSRREAGSADGSSGAGR